jgi:hypothetical protein
MNLLFLLWKFWSEFMYSITASMGSGWVPVVGFGLVVVSVGEFVLLLAMRWMA